MNVHPTVMNEIIRQRQLDMLDDAKRWHRAVRFVRRENHRRSD
jgi:hypothetical protein